jgi:caffeoyl-CoA O-methyltransferase
MIPNITAEITSYTLSNSAKDSPILQELIKHTIDNVQAPEMLSGPEVGNLLQLLVKMSLSKKILEIGMYTGYSALKMAEVIPSDGEIHTCELALNHIKTAQTFFNKSEHGCKIIIHPGQALISMEQMKSNSFDLIFIDADKPNYPDYYKRAVVLAKKNGIIILDNMLWSGKVLTQLDDDSKAIHKTNKLIQNDNRVSNTLLTVRDGLMICIKK